MLSNKLLRKVKVKNTDYQMKLVPGQTSEGILDPKAKQELEASLNQSHLDTSNGSKNAVNVDDIRKNMGWKKANHTNQHELSIENTAFNDVKVRVYVQTALQDKTLPTILFIHCGGFFGGSLDNVEYPCRTLADCGAVRVVSVDYGLAPEHPYPQDLLDCYQVLNYLAQHKNKLHISTITVMGDSAGGNLTYTVSLLDRLWGTNYVDKAIALYPVTYQGTDTIRRRTFDSFESLVGKEDSEEIKAYFDGFNSSQSLIDNWYLGDADKESPYISPLNAPEDLLKKMPKTLFIVGEFDPLRLQGEAFYNKMKLAGGDITYIRYNGMTHAFMDKVGDFIQADDALMEALKFILN